MWECSFRYFYCCCSYQYYNICNVAADCDPIEKELIQDILRITKEECPKGYGNCDITERREKTYSDKCPKWGAYFTEILVSIRFKTKSMAPEHLMFSVDAIARKTVVNRSAFPSHYQFTLFHTTKESDPELFIIRPSFPSSMLY